jgi:hypothetical protein
MHVFNFTVLVTVLKEASAVDFPPSSEKTNISP